MIASLIGWPYRGETIFVARRTGYADLSRTPRDNYYEMLPTTGYNQTNVLLLIHLVIYLFLYLTGGGRTGIRFNSKGSRWWYLISSSLHANGLSNWFTTLAFAIDAYWSRLRKSNFITNNECFFDTIVSRVTLLGVFILYQAIEGFFYCFSQYFYFHTTELYPIYIFAEQLKWNSGKEMRWHSLAIGNCINKWQSLLLYYLYSLLALLFKEMKNTHPT